MFGVKVESRALHMLGKSGPHFFFLNIVLSGSLVSSITTAAIQTLYLILVYSWVIYIAHGDVHWFIH